MKADLISLQAALVGLAVLLCHFAIRWFRASRRNRQMARRPDLPVQPQVAVADD
jgi:hypothetical protein